MTELVDSLAESIEEIAALAHAALEAPWRDKESLRDTLTQILSFATHGGVEAADLGLLVDLHEGAGP